jgi:ubiquinone/menaquinone biosynthesis C-methylase UbiE
MNNKSSDNMKLREQLYSFIDLERSKTILDLGCGIGYDLKNIGELTVRNDIQFIGIDSSKDRINSAKDFVGNDLRYEFICHDLSTSIPFNDEYFDVVYSKDLLECIVNKMAFLAEVARVLKPDGTVVFAHLDWDTQVIDGNNKELVRKIVHAFGDWKQAWMDDSDSWMGRRLWKTFQQTGLFDGCVHTYVFTNTVFEEPNITAFEALVKRNIISEQEYNEFISDIKALAEKDQYFYSINSYIYVGRKK